MGSEFKKSRSRKGGLDLKEVCSERHCLRQFREPKECDISKRENDACRYECRRMNIIQWSSLQLSGYLHLSSTASTEECLSSCTPLLTTNGLSWLARLDIQGLVAIT